MAATPFKKRFKEKGRLKKKLRKKLEARLGELANGQRAIVVCVGDECAPREQTRATFAAASARAAQSGDDRLRVACIGCLKVCKKGPIVAVLPEARLFRRVTADNVEALMDELRSDGRAGHRLCTTRSSPPPPAVPGAAADAAAIADRR